MSSKFSKLFFVIITATLVVACSSTPSSQPIEIDTEQKQAEQTKDLLPPSNSKFSKIEKGMVDSDVRKILGEPTSSNNYQTGKAWVPFYYGPDTHRTDYIYSGVGRVVFSRNRYSGNLKVINTIYNPSL